MEDEDCTVNDEGHIDVRYRGWTEIDSSIYSFHNQVLSLDLSFNHLQSLPEDIGCLRRLTSLNCENNDIENLPEGIGQLRALKHLNLNENKLTFLPASIGNCKKMISLHVNNNKITKLPQSIGNCTSLESLALANNDLIELPLSIAELKESLKHVNVTNNPNLSMIPEKVQGDSEVIMWIIVYSYEKTMELRMIRQGMKDMGKLMQQSKDRIESAEKEIERLKREQRELEIEREDVWMYIRFRDFRRRVQTRVKLLIQQCRNLFDKRSSQIVAE